MIKTTLTAAVVIGLGSLVLGAGTAQAAETSIVTGRENCEILREQYEAMGYSARCNNTHGENYYVSYSQKPGGPKPPEPEFDAGASLGSLAVGSAVVGSAAGSAVLPALLFSGSAGL